MTSDESFVASLHIHQRVPFCFVHLVGIPGVECAENATTICEV